MNDLLDHAPCGFLTLSDEGTILAVNATLRELLGYQEEDLPGQSVGVVLPAGGRVFYQTHIFPLLRLHGAAEEIYLSLRARSGVEIPMLVQATRRIEGSGVAVSHCVLVPMRQRLQYEEELLRARKSAEAAIAEAALANAREHTIASQLQQALQPELPPATPGLALTKYFEPALQLSEGVGGDFFDVFPLGNGCLALVVGDLSGKGLAAAAQVATVRNMLRAFLYTQPTLADALTELNQTLAVHELLTGFTTLFAGRYDADAGMLRYVSCGQEPALIRRAGSGIVEELGPTGPVLGAMEGVFYTEETMPLFPGDALAIFTDGLTEVGETRAAMLGIEGVSAIFGKPLPEEALWEPAELAEQLALRLIAGVDAAAQNGIRDDVCLLIGVVEE